MANANYTPAPPSDFVLAFDLPGVRGRLIRMKEASGAALSAHALPEAAGRVLGETLTLSALLGSTLKLDGRLTAQVKGAGPLDLVTTDYFGPERTGEHDAPAGVRGYARVDETKPFDARAGFASLVGKGALAITIEPRRGGETYQGIVKLGGGIAESAEAYFAQSEQLPTAIRLAAVPAYEAGQGMAWRTGGMLLQATPDARRDDDDWERLKMFLATLEDVELVDTALAAETLLWRLFHEDEVRVHNAEPIAFRCACDPARIAGVLKSYPEAQRAGLADEDGIIRARCEFCGVVHQVDAMGLL